MNPETSIEQSIDVIQSRLSAAVLQYMATAGKRLKDISEIEDLSDYLYSSNYLDDVNGDLRKVNKSLNTAHRQNIHDMNSLFKGVTAEVYSAGREMAEYKDTRLSPLASYRQEASPLLRQVMNSYEVMAKSTTVNNDYKKIIRQYVNRLTMGGEDNAPTAMRRAIRELTEQGITTIDYKSGRHVRMDTAVRRDLMAEYTNIVQQVQNKVGEEIGADAFEISAHQHAAIDHEPIQGRIFTLEEFEKLQNGEEARDVDLEKYEAGEADYLGEVFQTDRPIGMYNCRHIWFSFILGVSIPSFSKDELEAIQERNEDGIEFHGEHYTLYEGEQKQRQLESQMRAERENLNLLKEVREVDPRLEHDYQKSKARLAELREEYKQLGAALEPKAMRSKWERSFVPKGSIGNASLPKSAISVESTEEMKKQLGITDISLPTINEEVGKEVSNTINNFYNKYPAMKGLVEHIDDKETREDAGASMGHKYTEKEGLQRNILSLNKQFFGLDVKELEKIWEGALEKKYHPEGTTWQSMIEHELAHAIEGHIRIIEKGKGNTAWGLSDMLDPIFESFDLDPLDYKGGKKSSIQKYVSENVSGYALTNIGKGKYAELFAEAVSEYLSRGDKARDFAKAVGRAIEPYLAIKIR